MTKNLHGRSFNLACDELDLSEVQKEITENYRLFGERMERIVGDSPHRESLDIWFRFGDQELMEWMQPADKCPSVIALTEQLRRIVGASEIGGVLCTKLPPNCQIYPHVDGGWHAEKYRKWFVPVQNDEGCEFVFDDGVVPASVGQAWEFDNSVSHWVKNQSKRDRIALIICMR